MRGAILDLTVRELLGILEHRLRIDVDYTEGKDGVAHWRHGPFFLCADRNDYLEIPMRSSKSRDVASVKIRFEVLFHKTPEGRVEIFRIYRQHRTSHMLGTLELDADDQKLRMTLQTSPGRITTRSCAFRPEPEVRYSLRYLLDLKRKLCRVSLKLADSDLEPAEELLYKNVVVPGLFAAALRLVMGKRPTKGHAVAPTGAEFSDLEFVAGA